MISAKVVADSLSPQGDRLISLLINFPRIILAEVNTHRMLSKNTSSSRAIPFKKMVEAVKDNPFIPIAWQKDHSGMQGSEYLDPNKKVTLDDFIVILYDTLNSYDKDSKEYAVLSAKLKERVELVETILFEYRNKVKSLIDWWLFARDKAVEMATILYVLNVTKQLCNRLLEPFMWTTMLITGTYEGGWDNFFNLRCPQYVWDSVLHKDIVFKSKKDLIKELDNTGLKTPSSFAKSQSDLDWLKMNKGQAEIHMMQLAECIYDAVNESKPKQLKAGEWHIPFGNQIDERILTEIAEDDYYNLWQRLDEDPDFDWWVNNKVDNLKVKASTAMGARTSYTIVGEEKEMSYSKLIELDDRLLNKYPPHSSPMEHCNVAMSDHEYKHNVKGKSQGYINRDDEPFLEMEDNAKGWCRNFRGFIQRRHLIETGG